MAKAKQAAPDAEQAQAQSDFAEWVERKEAVVLVLDFPQAWAAMSAIQTITVNDTALGPLREYAIEVGNMIERLVSKTPALAAFARAGWRNGEGQQ